MFLVVDLENSDDLGKSFYVVMCFTVTEISTKRIESKCHLVIFRITVDSFETI